jgi:hypothetical protein
MGWTVHYQAKIPGKLVDEFLQAANSARLNLDEYCEAYQWEASGEGLVSGFTKVHFSKNSEKDFLSILKAIKTLSEKWIGIEFIVSDDYYLQEEDIRKVDIGKILEPPEKSEDKPFNLDAYVFEYEIPYGLTVKMAGLLSSIENKELAERAEKSLAAWNACGAKEVYARKSMFKPYVKDINNEMIFLEAPADNAARQAFLGALSKQYGNEITLPEDKRIVVVFLLKRPPLMV